MRLNDFKISIWIVVAVLCSVLGSYYLGRSEDYFYIGQQLEEEIGLIVIASLCHYFKFTTAEIIAGALLILSFGKLYDMLHKAAKLPYVGDWVFFVIMCCAVIARILYIWWGKRKLKEDC